MQARLRHVQVGIRRFDVRVAEQFFHVMYWHPAVDEPRPSFVTQIVKVQVMFRSAAREGSL